MKTMIDVVAATRAVMTHEAWEARERRALEEIEQRSESRTPAERIKLWERRHQLALPADPEHRLNQVIASQTALSIADLAREVARRARPVVSRLPIV